MCDRQSNSRCAQNDYIKGQLALCMTSDLEWSGSWLEGLSPSDGISLGRQADCHGVSYVSGDRCDEPKLSNDHQRSVHVSQA